MHDRVRQLDLQLNLAYMVPFKEQPIVPPTDGIGISPKTNLLSTKGPTEWVGIHLTRPKPKGIYDISLHDLFITVVDQRRQREVKCPHSPAVDWS